MPFPAACLFFASGACGLVYELVWTRQLGYTLGTFATATATVLGVFMAGLGLGNWLLGRRAAKLGPAGAMRLYAALEAMLAAYAAASPLLFSASSRLYPALLASSPEPLVRAIFAGLLLLPATVVMGGTLPAMAQALIAFTPGRLGALYAVNTVGGAVGPLLAAFVLLPGVGLARTIWAAAAVNAAVAAGAFLLASRLPESPPECGVSPEGETPRVSVSDTRADAETPNAPAADKPIPAWFVLTLAAGAGFISMAMEVALTRRLVLTVTGGSVYAFATVLSAFLGGIALGATLLRWRPPRDAVGALAGFAVAMTVVFGYALLTAWGDTVPLLLATLWARTTAFGLRMALNAATVAVLLLPVTAFGYCLPVLAGALPKASADAVGRLFAANTLGAALGAPLAGFWLIQWLGLDRTLLALGMLALAAGLAAALRAARPRWRPILVPAAAGLLALVAIVPSPDPAVMEAGLYNRASAFVMKSSSHLTLREALHQLGPIVYERDGLTGRIAIREAGPNQMGFIVNGKPDGSSMSSDLLTEIASIDLAMLCHPRPRKVLLIGLGTGISAGAVLAHPEVEELDIAEIEPRQVEVARIFAAHNHEALADRRVRVHIDDARHFLLTSPDSYDVIVSEPSNLFVSGMVNLYTVEALLLARRRLAPGGLLLQFLHYYQIGERDLLGALATFQTAFPQTTYWVQEMGDSFMMGSDTPLAIDLAAWEARGRAPALARELGRAGIKDPLALLAAYRFGPADAAHHTRGAPLCRDDFPFLEFTTPHVPWSEAITARRRIFLQSLPVSAPVPLLRETVRGRVRLGGVFLEGADLMRARIEFKRALELDPGSGEAKRGLKQIDAYYERDSSPARRSEP